MNGGGITVEAAWNIGKAMADWLPTQGGVLVTAAIDDFGQNMAIAGLHLQGASDLLSAAIEGLRLQGRAVVFSSRGSRDAIASQIVADQLAGAVIVGRDAVAGDTMIELYASNGKRIENDALDDIRHLANAGNFVPAGAKGELTQLA